MTILAHEKQILEVQQRAPKLAVLNRQFFSDAPASFPSPKALLKKTKNLLCYARVTSLAFAAPLKRQ